MMTAARRSTDFLNGVPELVVLSLLSRRPMHGYDLLQAIRKESGQALQFGEGLIYPLLHYLEGEGALAGRHEKVAGRERVVYRVTATGRKRLEDSAGVWRQVTDAIRSVLEGTGDGRPAMA